MKDIVTPAYIFDIDILTARVAYLRRLFGSRFKLCYAVKANPFLIAELAELCDGLEVCSPGEYRICERLGVPPEKIVLSGVYKERGDIERVVKHCGGKTLYTVESVSQWRLLSETAESAGIVLPVLLRLSSGNQFGSDKTAIENMIKENDPHLDVKGIQLYSGTQKKLAKMQKETESLLSWIDTLEADLGFVCKRIEYGPGLPVSYFENGPDADEEAIAEWLKTAFSHVRGDTEIVLEAGRSFCASCGKYVTTVVDVKHNDGVNYAIVDGGINHLNYYGQTMAMKVPHMTVTPDGEPSTWTVCGSLCTAADVLVRGCVLPELKPNSMIAFENAGAYSVTEGIYLFLSRDMPRIYKVKDGKTALVRDVLRTDAINSAE